ncbi:MAG: ECF RNA polymerase sigma factor SigK [Acidimicrobiia bacterium]
MYHPPTLNELFSRIVQRDRDAFSDLYDELSPLVYGLAMRTTKSAALAEEVTQEVFIQVWRQAERFDSSKGSARSWVATLAHRRAVDVVRKTQASADRDDALPPEFPAADVSEDVVESDERARVRAAVGELTDLQREAIELAYFGGLTYREVAERLETPLGTVKTRMRDGLARMRSIMERGDG